MYLYPHFARAFLLFAGTMKNMTRIDLSVRGKTPGVVLAVHGGAGTILPQNVTPEIETACRTALENALRAGQAVRNAGGDALDMAEAAVRVLEDDPHFNAGRGAVFSHNGTNELDAAIMDGATQKAGAVAGIVGVKNPVTLARSVMEQSPFVFLGGRGAEDFARSVDAEFAPPAYFATPERLHQLQTLLAREAENGDAIAQTSLSEDNKFGTNKFGTVGAVARDAQNHLAAATSTGGMTNKRWGRIGDCPVIGAGTWADLACAISATGHGEYFIRCAVAHEISARIRFAGEPLTQAAQTVVLETLITFGGDGGVIALDAQGNAALPFNTSGMYRGVLLENGQTETAIYSSNALGVAEREDVKPSASSVTT